MKIKKSVAGTSLILTAAFALCAIASLLLLGLGLAPKNFALPLGGLIFILACAVMVWMRRNILLPMLRISSSAQTILYHQTSIADSLELPDEFALVEIALREAADPPRFIPQPAQSKAIAGESARDLFERELVHLIERCKRRNEGAILALARIRFFDRISAAFGPAAAEHYAEAMLARLSTLYIAPARVFRYDRNILAIVKISVAPGTFGSESDAIAATAVQAFRGPVRWRDQGLSSEAHIALAAYPRDADSASALQRAAGAALDTVPNDAPAGTVRATENSARDAREQMQMAERVRAGIASGEFEPYFQPVVDLRQRRVVGVELLARWPGTHGTMTDPSKFITVAEDTNQVTALSNLLFTKAAQSMKAWRDHGVQIPVSVNVSGNMINSGLPDIVTGIMRRTGLPPELLEIEITETAIFHRPNEAEAVLLELVSLGLSLSLDDFGTGYSSLSYLLRLPISKIKIDQSFTSRVMTDPVSLSIVRATISLAQSLGHAVVAEGVSDREISTRLLELGCHLQQGFGFSPGLPSADALQWIKRWEGSGQTAGAL